MAHAIQHQHFPLLRRWRPGEVGASDGDPQQIVREDAMANVVKVPKVVKVVKADTLLIYSRPATL
jgi:hypothetical protein